MDQVTISRDLLRQVIGVIERSQAFVEASADRKLRSGWGGQLDEAEIAITALRTALEQPAVESLTVHQIRLSDATWVNCCETTFDYHNSMGWKTRTLQTYAAPQAQQPPRVGPGMSVEQTLEQWEHDFKNPMTPEQQTDWVNREREFASAQAQQPAPVQEPSMGESHGSTEYPQKGGFKCPENGRLDREAIRAADAATERADAMTRAASEAIAQQPRKAVKLTDEQPECSTHPDAPHGFDRNRSHSLGRYVCDCEGWMP